MTLVVEKAGLTYVSVRKCGCTSLKYFCNEVNLATGSLLGRKRFASIHSPFESTPYEELRSRVAAGELSRELYTVIRRPLDRIYSCYKDKICKNRTFKEETDEDLAKIGITRFPSFDEFVERLGDYRKASRRIADHTLPLSWYLGKDPSEYARIYTLSKANKLMALINERAKTEVELEHRNKAIRGQIEKPSDWAAGEVNRMFAEDYEIFGEFLEAA